MLSLARGMSAQTACSNSTRSIRRRGSGLASSRAKLNVEAIIVSISARSASIFCCCSDSPISSARSRIRVIGVRKSWEMAAIIRVRSSTKRRIRSCMSLKARIAWMTSVAPASGRGGALTLRPSRSAAWVRVLSGAVSNRIPSTERPSTMISVTRISAVVAVDQAGTVSTSGAAILTQVRSASCSEMTYTPSPGFSDPVHCACGHGRH